MATDDSPSPGGRAGTGRRCGAPTRVDLLTFLVAAMLCSASYCLGVWHNSRGAADSRILGPSAAVAVPVGAATSSCGADADEPLDFESHHAAESAGLSVSSSSSSAEAAAATTSARRALRGAAPESRGRNRVAWARGSARASAEAGGGGLRLTDAGAVSA
ncbi:unnamed protein product [Urochloa decumbens]|uniref:Uncharacterized protein n=1 Tax=Urochloa decumbens TaxID=240449 RepID=A0ABC8XVP5_9POAL